MQRCEICQQDTETAPIGGLTQLNLYINGSEGIRVCFSCRMTLSNLAVGMAEQGMRAMKAQRLIGKIGKIEKGG
jgi:hypothetical protein